MGVASPQPTDKGTSLEKDACLYVLDTSVLIHDPEALRSYRNTSIAVPIFVVMELDDLKTSPRHEVASSARVASRRIVSLMEHGSLHDPNGVEDPETGSTVYVVSNDDEWEKTLKETSSSRKMDHMILGTAIALRPKFPHLKVILVSKDVNLRILADSQGISAEDYNQDRVQEDEIPKGFRVLQGVEPEELQGLFLNEDGGETHSTLKVEGLVANEFVLCGQQVFRWKREKLSPVSKSFRGTGVTPRNIEQRMALDLLTDPSVHLVTLLGIAGTGKSFLALAAAISQLGKQYEKIILSKPIVAMGKDLGYLPGSESEKMQPWMLSFYDNLDQLMSTDGDESGRKGAKERTWEQLFHAKKIEIQPLHSIRGRSIAKSIMIIDECQNLSPHEVKTIVSRAATGTKVVLCGDPYQIDDAYLDRFTNGLVHAATSSRGNAIAGTVTLTEGVRSPLAELAATRL
jgi:PhoH-like ATPase